MSAKILFRDASGRDGAVELRGEPVYVGRAVDCAIRTDDAMVSRKHSMIRFDQGRYWVEDLGSSNGTHVNDVKVQRQALNHNDVVRCGSLWLRYIEEGPLMPMGMPAGMGSTRAGHLQAMPGGMQPGMQPGMQGGMPGMPGMPGMGGVPGSGDNLGFASTVATSPKPGSIPGVGGYGASPGVAAISPMQPPPSVVVNMEEAPSSEEVRRLRAQVDDAKAQFEAIRSERDKEIAENKRLRAEHSTLQQRIDDARTQLKENDEVVEAHKRVAEELRFELDQTKDDLQKVSAQLTETQEDLASRSRQLQRAQEDVTKAKQEGEQHKKQLTELSRMKDDGWKKVNEQVAEVEHLREVIREQERILEERRVGLISLEESVKELRQEKESRLKELAALKAERNELKANEQVFGSNIRVLEEENRRLARLLSDLEAGGTGGGETGEIMRLSNELKELRVDLKKQETEKQKFADALDRSEQRAEKLASDLARLQVEGSSENAKIEQIEGARQKADEARTKAEVAKQKAEDERSAAIVEKETALREADEARLEADRMRRKMADYEFDQSEKKGGGDAAVAAKLQEAERRLRELEGELEKVRAAGGGGGGGDGDVGELRTRAGEVYNNINDALSDLRMNVSLVKDEAQALAGKDSNEHIRTILDAIESAVSQTEDLKGVLRGLRELAEA